MGRMNSKHISATSAGEITEVWVGVRSGRALQAILRALAPILSVTGCHLRGLE